MCVASFSDITGRHWPKKSNFSRNLAKSLFFLLPVFELPERPRRGRPLRFGGKVPEPEALHKPVPTTGFPHGQNRFAKRVQHSGRQRVNQSRQSYALTDGLEQEQHLQQVENLSVWVSFRI